MLDAFARQAYRAHLNRADSLVEAFTSLPNDTLRKLASGNLSCGGDSKDWLEKFQGTPLYDSAMELLQEELQQEAEELQSREQQQQFYSASDQLRLKKKLLELELARSQMAPPTPAPSVAPTPEVPSTATAGPQGGATQTNQQPPDGAPPKTAEAVWMAAMMSSEEKQASARFTRALEKMGGLGGSLLNVAKAHPGLVGGAGLGALMGGVRGAQQKIDPATGRPVGGGVTGALSGAIGGGVLGGGVGLAGQGLLRSGLAARKTVADAAKAGIAHKGFLPTMQHEVGQRAGGFLKQLGGGAKNLATSAEEAGAGMQARAAGAFEKSPLRPIKPVVASPAEAAAPAAAAAPGLITP